MTMKDDPEVKTFGVEFEFTAQELHRRIERLNGSFRPFTEESYQR
jgi:hypothetical protein